MPDKTCAERLAEIQAETDPVRKQRLIDRYNEAGCGPYVDPEHSGGGGGGNPPPH